MPASLQTLPLKHFFCRPIFVYNEENAAISMSYLQLGSSIRLHVDMATNLLQGMTGIMIQLH